MRALSVDHRRIFAGFDAKLTKRWPLDRFLSIGTSALAEIDLISSSESMLCVHLMKRLMRLQTLP